MMSALVIESSLSIEIESGKVNWHCQRVSRRTRASQAPTEWPIPLFDDPLVRFVDLSVGQRSIRRPIPNGVGQILLSLRYRLAGVRVEDHRLVDQRLAHVENHSA